jgi:hypothetical protein
MVSGGKFLDGEADGFGELLLAAVDANQSGKVLPQSKAFRAGSVQRILLRAQPAFPPPAKRS